MVVGLQNRLRHPPYYLEEVDPDRTLGENIQRTILSRHGTLRNEPDYVLRMELREPTRYFSILEAIAGGSTSRNEIAGTTGIAYDQLSKYLNRLARLRLVEQAVPITERKERTKRSRYRIRDHIVRFWFNFVYGTGDRYDSFGDDAYEVLNDTTAQTTLTIERGNSIRRVARTSTHRTSQSDSRLARRRR
nr:hypothetical protein [Halomarina sp. PSRA2]